MNRRGVPDRGAGGRSRVHESARRRWSLRSACSLRRARSSPRSPGARDRSLAAMSLLTIIGALRTSSASALMRCSAAAISSMSLQLVTAADAVALAAIRGAPAAGHRRPCDDHDRRTEQHLAGASGPLTATAFRKLCQIRTATPQMALAAPVADGRNPQGRWRLRDQSIPDSFPDVSRRVREGKPGTIKHRDQNTIKVRARAHAPRRCNGMDPRAPRRHRGEARVVIDLMHELSAWLRSTDRAPYEGDRCRAGSDRDSKRAGT